MRVAWVILYRGDEEKREYWRDVSEIQRKMRDSQIWGMREVLNWEDSPRVSLKWPGAVRRGEELKNVGDLEGKDLRVIKRGRVHSGKWEFPWWVGTRTDKWKDKPWATCV